MKIFQISSEVNIGSVGRIAEQIGEQIIERGWESYIAFGRENLPSKSKTIQISNKFELIKHVLYSRFADRHGFASKNATAKLVEKIKEIKPDIIQLQHLHGYYINIEILFKYLSKSKIPVVWTFHDCWSFTGHCAYYDLVDCQKWQTQCEKCPQINEYPKSFGKDNSFKNFNDKKRLFNSVENLTIVPVSKWLGCEVEKSFLKNNKIEVIQNGIDIEQFSIQNTTSTKEKYNLQNKFVILGVANPWDKRKGLNYFIDLSEKISDDYQILLVGLDKDQIIKLPKNIIGLERTSNVQELAELYSAADVFLNPTLEDTFPTTNLEALACGTPVITFRTGGSPEAINESTGCVVEKGSLDGIIESVMIINHNTKESYTKNCRNRAEKYFDKKLKFKEYIKLYETILKK
ncbi:glycosyltransferase [Frigoriflavimonas asaccharolytica]|uniref:Glycosyltransferase involved in cell wall biosynthesis n=1 Tax=Frigoriflavimonas asaccharolytica TaxID=2735899 RepID=A0A8J8G5Q6_9FLAO|nr:glycosyltransferase [Frigoriflavimonas asaccharolytica]NRS91719.1 glycosyltransferase involved in cell wall biosynthesis [Frigoriflavimonas asaccharolytica]